MTLKSFDEWQKSTDTELNQSKRKKIEILFDEIEKAQAKGAKIWHLVQWLKEAHDIAISEKYLHDVLYRIRKKKNGSSTEKKSSVDTSSPLEKMGSNTTKQIEPISENYYDALMEKYKQCRSPVERYVALGGNIEDIEDRSSGVQRQMVHDLKYRLRVKYKGLY